LLWLFNPMAVLVLWGVDDASHQLMVERRLGVVLLGVGVLLLASRNAGPSPARSAICYGVATSATALVALSIYDLIANGISSGIVPGIGINVATALAFIAIEWHAYRTQKKSTSP
jgi:hypothetical protein